MYEEVAVPPAPRPLRPALRSAPFVRRPTPEVLNALAWAGAAVFPVALYFTVFEIRNYSITALQVLLPALLSVLPVGLLRRRPLPALLSVLVGMFAAGTTVHAQRGELPRGYPVMPVQMESGWAGYALILSGVLAVGIIAATRSLRLSIGAAVAVLAVQASVAPYFTSGSNDYTSTLVLFFLVLAVAWVTGYSVRERRQHAAALSAQASTQAVTAERLRIARELHDMVAHSIGIIAIQAGVGSRVIETQPQEARNALTAIETTSRDTLSGLRRMLGALRQAEPGHLPEGAPLDPVPGLADLDRLAATTTAAGVRVDVEWVGERRLLPADLDLSAYRIVQEAVTNVVRHSGAPSCRVTLLQQQEEIGIEIVDEGRGGSRPQGIGYGLVGMRERAALLHGEFTAGPRPGGGFRVTARLPLPADATAVAQEVVPR
ncbi:sensor histidine kinase [Streptomyces sp. NPDC048442]|uniref:sensor histidine kinase n=1 Tax=Streptomyces sp. NPDC048442 TaxID=3154823 RepID=UPI0034191DDB